MVWLSCSEQIGSLSPESGSVSSSGGSWERLDSWILEVVLIVYSGALPPDILACDDAGLDDLNGLVWGSVSAAQFHVHL